MSSPHQDEMANKRPEGKPDDPANPNEAGPGVSKDDGDDDAMEASMWPGEFTLHKAHAKAKDFLDHLTGAAKRCDHVGVREFLRGIGEVTSGVVLALERAREQHFPKEHKDAGDSLEDFSKEVKSVAARVDRLVDRIGA